MMRSKKNNQITIFGIQGIPEIKSGFNLGVIICQNLMTEYKPLNGDIIVIAQKVVSKAENCIVDLELVKPSEKAKRISRITQKNPRLVQLILNETKEIIRVTKGVLIVETNYGYICANAGIDSSNLSENNLLSVLPSNPDKSADNIRNIINNKFGVKIGVIISDSFNRPWRKGSINVALGISGFNPFLNLIGEKDDFGNPLKSTLVNIADEIACAAQLVMGENSRIPVAAVRGFNLEKSNMKGYDLLREKENDLFR